MVLDKNTLMQQWNSLNKDWYSIYQWHGTSRVGYTELVAKWIIELFDDIQLETKGLREKDFRIMDHRGQAKLSRSIGQFTEKRFVRAVFNLGQLSLLGKIIDYEVPLKATQDANHGDIDMLCLASNAIMCVEAKSLRSTESVLKAILQAYVYTSLTYKRHNLFVSEFHLPTTLLLTPAVLTFASAASGRQLHQWDKYPCLGALVRRLNAELSKSGCGGIRFFIINNDKLEPEPCLTTVEQPNGDKKIVFAHAFTPNIVEWPSSVSYPKGPVDCLSLG